MIFRVTVLVAVSCLSTAAWSQDEGNGNPEIAQRRLDEQSAKLEELLTKLEEQSKKEPIPNRLRDLKPLVPVGEATPRVREIQATLNEKLADPESSEEEGDRSIPLPPGGYKQRDYQKIRASIAARVRAAEIDGELFSAEEESLLVKKKVWTLVSVTRDVDGFALKIRGDWKPEFSGTMPDPLDDNSSQEDREKYEADIEAYYSSPLTAIKLPRSNPILVDGVYGERTFTAVWLFQISNNLFPTGEVDAVTLDKLEPMVPQSWLLARIMKWFENSELKAQDKYALWVKRKTSMVATAIILFFSALVYLVARVFGRSTHFLSRFLFTPSNSPWVATLREKKFFTRFSEFAPAFFIYFAANIFPDSDHPFPYLSTFSDWNIGVARLGLAYAALVGTRLALVFVDTCDAIYTDGLPDDNPIQGIIRAAKRIVLLVGLVLIGAAVTGQNPVYFVGGLGAFMAVIVLVFRNTLLGFVAAIQIVSNKLVQVGDWIELEEHGADGYVQGISLTCVKVQNFDNTVCMIPTYRLLSESFHNWSSMIESGGRRVKRCIFIDMHSIKACTPEMIERFSKIEYLSEYIEAKTLELRHHNEARAVHASKVNARRLTNIGTFRVYLEAYLRDHPKLHGEMTMLVRHLQPTREGLPVEIYAFSTETALAEYERVQADIFDHVLSILPEFELRAFQEMMDRGDREELDAVDAESAAMAILSRFVEEQNEYLRENPRTRVATAARKVNEKIDSLDLSETVTTSISGREIQLHVES